MRMRDRSCDRGLKYAIAPGPSRCQSSHNQWPALWPELLPGSLPGHPQTSGSCSWPIHIRAVADRYAAWIPSEDLSESPMRGLFRSDTQPCWEFIDHNGKDIGELVRQMHGSDRRYHSSAFGRTGSEHQQETTKRRRRCFATSSDFPVIISR
jgi:hypothetical protein